MMSPFEYQLYYQRNLPHYQPPGATLFITFRLADSLPKNVLERLEAEKRQREFEIINSNRLHSRPEAAYLAQKALFARWDAELDAARHGPRWLAQPEIARLVNDALHFRDGVEYRLDAHCLMPNHVHLVCTPLEVEGEFYPISRIMHSLKGYTARHANLLLGRQGSFWQHESYDHVVRDDTEFERILRYVMQNPLRAGLQSDWVYCRISDV